MNLFRTMAVVLLTAAMAPVLAARADEEEDTTPKRLWYVNYWQEEWKESERLLPRAAQLRAAYLSKMGATTRIIDVGVNPPPGTTYPDPKKFSVVQRVQFRLTSLKSQPFDDVDRARREEKMLQGLGFEVELSPDAPMPRIPAKARESFTLASSTTWNGKITQQDHQLPARLVLTRSGDRVRGVLSFTFQKYNYLGQMTERRSYRAEVAGRVTKDGIVFTTTKALQGRVYLATQYNGKVSGGNLLQGEWDNEAEGLAGKFSFSLSE